jgi:hypothetical protein
MHSIIEILKQFPAIFAALGILGGGIAMFFVMLKFGPMRHQAQTELIDAYKEKDKVTKDLLVMQKDHYDNELSEIKSEKEDYKSKLHAEKEAHQATLFTVADLQARPNVDKVYEGQQEFFRKNTDCMQALLKMVQEHDASIEDRTKAIIQPVIDVCEQIAKALNGHKLRKVTRAK